MREPDLVFKAQQAAAALERAWERWRVVHGMTADPMPAISSYVGYSLEEPWGQPRVVFGISAEDAVQLVALLDRHACIGPAHPTSAAGQGGRELAPEASGQPERLPSVPRQAPSRVADSPAAEPPAAELGRQPRFAGTADRGVEQDGPVFRQLVAAARKATGTLMAVHAGAEPDVADAGSAVGVLDVDADRGEAVAADSGTANGRPSGAEPVAQAEPEAAAEVIAADAAAPSGAPNGGDGATEAGPAATAETAREGETAASAQAVPAAGTTKDAGIVPDAAPADANNARPDDSADDPPGDLDEEPGPLAQAASTARTEAEARIRAAVCQAEVAEPTASQDHVAAGPDSPLRDASPGDNASNETTTGEAATKETASDEAASDEGATDETAADGGATDGGATDQTNPPTTLVSAPPASAPAAKPGSAEKPPVDAGVVEAGVVEAPTVAKPGHADEPGEAGVEAADRGHPNGIASSLGRPESGAEEVSRPGIGAFGFGSDLVGSVGSYHEPGTRSDQSQDHASPGHARRNRSNRAYSIPRLSKSKRAGVSPGA